MGAAAVSVSGFSTEELRGARILSSGGLRTNLHFILSSESLAVARAFLEGRFDAELSGINAVVFLTYKRAGRARAPLWLGNGPELDGFLSAVEAPRTALSFGFDACFAPILIRSTGLDARVFDSCECAFFSVYIDERLRVRPCSFSNGSSTCFDLREHSFREVWERGFEEYREKMLSSPCALLCELGESCRGACPVFPELALCADHRRESYE
jgi:radical SAM protein with 4Fe4S-binding SPASM domain